MVEMEAMQVIQIEYKTELVHQKATLAVEVEVEVVEEVDLFLV